LAIPFYHTGIRLTYNPNDKVMLMGGVVNGWNDVVDNNTGKTVMFTVMYKPNAATAISENYIGGPEQPSDSTDWRTLSDTVVTYTVNPKVSLIGNYDYTRDTVLGKTNTTQGVAGYVKFQANKWVAVVPRAEYFKDGQGAPWATGLAGGQNLTEFTLTLEAKAADNFMWRTEYRGDFSNKSPFRDSTGVAKKNQQSLTFGFLYSFSSKS
jgi:hypothetical protein